MGGFTPTKGQQYAIEQLKKFKADHSAKWFLLTSGAGMGKSWLTANYILPMFPDIALTATTHKACEAINKNLNSNVAVTIHSLLGLKLKREDDKQVLKTDGKPKQVPKVILVDECSMIGKDLLSFILKTDSKVIFVGDPEQIEPIEEGDSADVSPCFDLDTEYKVELTEVTRQALDNPIIALATDIRLSEERFDLSKVKSASTIYTTSKPPEEIAKSCANAINHDHDARVIAYTNAKVLYMNKLIHESLYGRSEFPFMTGEKVVFNEMYTHKMGKGKLREFRNNEECTVLNVRWHDTEPDVVLVALKDEEGTMYENVVMHMNPPAIEQQVKNLFGKYWSSNRRDKQSLEEAWALKTKYAPLRHCYAITNFKSQGQTVDIAFIDAYDMNRMRNDRSFNRALYVACTRPRNMLIINYHD